MRTTIASLLLALAVAGCATPPHRARQYRAAYEALPKETQERASRGYIREGDTAEAVYIAMGPPQTREKLRDDIGVYEDHWIYLGRPASDQNTLEPGNYRFVTVNDVSWSNPFISKNTKHIHIVFVGNTVQRVEVQELSSSAHLSHPKITMPQQ